MLHRCFSRLAAVAFAAAVFLCGGAKAQTINCTGPTGGNCVPVVQITPPAGIGVGSGNAGYPPGSTPLTALFNGADATTASATFPAVSGQYNYICGFRINGLGATAATTVTPTIAGLSNTFTYTSQYTFVAGVTTATTPFNDTFGNFCPRSSAVNTAISVTVPGAAGNTSTIIEAWGYQQ